MHITTRIIVLLLLFTVTSGVLSGCGFASSSNKLLQNGETFTAPDFTLKDLSGKTVNLSSFKGKKVVLNFWAVWCVYCKKEMPEFNELNKTIEKDYNAVILAVDVQESPDTVKEYLSKNNFNLNVLFDVDGSVTQKYNVSGFPTTFFINEEGKVYSHIPGATNKETIIENLKKSR